MCCILILNVSLCRSFTHFLTGVCAIIGGVFTGGFVTVHHDVIVGLIYQIKSRV